jgi:hypothetical protein
MAKIRAELQQVLAAVNRLERREQITRLIARTDGQTTDADALLLAGAGQAPDRAFQVVAGQAAFADDIEDAEATAPDGEHTIWARIRHWLGRAGRKLWAMISRLVKVKEWSLTGTVGTGVLGLAEASISVTFG